ncbi:MAG: hypothetical protein JOZ18_19525 [Chloroflexi bacterium]|nr:hypothetical protein [Chloroflexota bacterium]
MLASIKQEGLKMTLTPGFTWDPELRIFKGPILYGDELFSLCVIKERMQRSLNDCLHADMDIEQLFNSEWWVSAAEHPHDQEVYFEEEEDLDLETT